MLFTSLDFIILVTVVAILYYTVGKNYQTYVLLFGSYCFYYIALPEGLLFVWVTTLSAYLVAIHMSKIQDQLDVYLAGEGVELSKKEKKLCRQTSKKRKKKAMLIAVLLSLGILAVTKYTNFAIANVNVILEKFTNISALTFVDLIVPLGISFYTFMTVSYVLDVYHNRYAAEKNLAKVALYVSFFPQMIQGPISRFNDVSKTMFERHDFDKKNVCFALQRILWGYFKKLVIADRVYVGVCAIVQNPDEFTGAFVFVGMILYTIQMYADFTGGIDITIGVAELFGIKLKENFRRPYFSKSLKEYWTRWHITMGSWFADYVFYPVSISPKILELSRYSRKKFGNEIGKRVPLYVAVLAVWLTTGIWHGASWYFVVWGLLNGTIILISNELEPLYAKFHSKFHVEGKLYYKIFRVLRTLLLISALRMLDYYRNITLSFQMFGSLFTDWNLSALFNGGLLSLGLSVGDFIIIALSVLLLLVVSLKQRAGSVREYISHLSYPRKVTIWYGLCLIILVFGMYGIGFESSQFIYNQF
ncbi:MAG: MBOAT family O-acyltransferase [Eubacteriales bacterium]